MASKLRVDHIEPVGGIPSGGGGGIIQIVRAQSTTANQTPGSSDETSYTDVTPTCTITPTSTSSKILIVGSTGCTLGANNHIAIALTRTSTIIRKWYYYCDEAYSALHFGGWHLDSPATTSAITYKYSISSQGTNTQFMWNYQGPSATDALRQAEMYLVEVSG